MPMQLYDAAAERVGSAVTNAFRDVLGDRLVALVIHGSAVTGYLPDLSDFDFVVFMHGRLDLRSTEALQARLGETDIRPFTYLQVSRVIDVDEASVHSTGLIEGVFATLYGEIPPGWDFLGAEDLRESGREALRGVQARWHSRNENWAVEGGAQRKRRLRWNMTDIKPATRALLVESGEPPLEIWSADYWELLRRLQDHDASLAAQLEVILTAIPISTDREATVGMQMLRYLDAVGARAQTMGIN
jgi:hypothetical protein